MNNAYFCTVKSIIGSEKYNKQLNINNLNFQIMKKFTLLMVAGLFALAGSVKAQKKVIFTAEDVTFGEDLKGNLEVFMNYETTETVAGWNFSLYIPDGVTIGTKLVENEDTGEMEETYDYTAKGNDYSNSAKMANNMKIEKKTDGGYLFVCIASDQTPMKNTQGKILTLPLVASSSEVSGQGKITTLGMTSDKSVSLELGNIEEVVFAVGNGEDGINDIQAADATAPAYNLQGIRVNSNAKGVIIRDGKKMVVK